MPDTPVSEPDSEPDSLTQNEPVLAESEESTSSLPESTESPKPPASNEQPDLTAAEPTPPTPESETLPAHISPSPEMQIDGSEKPKKSPHVLKPLIILIIILAAVAVIAVYLDKHHNQQTTGSKKDIPYLTYGFSDSGDITPAYPIEGAETNNTIFLDTQIMEGLVVNSDQTKIAPLLATSWENPDSSTWVFNLRHGVKFHSGRTMTATDVKYSLDYAVAHQNNDNGATDLFLANSIKQVDIVNPYQVKITTIAPDAVLLNRLTSLFILDSKAKLGDPNAGTGPYIVKPGTVKPNATSLDLAAFDGYWGGHVYTRAIHFHEEPTIDALAAATAKGQYDVSGDYDSQQTALIKSKVSYYQPLILSDLGVNFITLNTVNKNSPLYYLAARQAITNALDTSAILKAGALTGTPATQVIPPAIPGYDPSIKAIPYDPAKAKQLLTSVPNLSTTITLNFPADDYGQVGEIAKELNAVGFHVKLNAINDLSALVNMTVAGQGDIFYLGYDTSTLDGLDMINNVVLGNQDYNSPEITTLAGQAGNTLDPATRIATLQKIEQLVAKNIPTVALFSLNRTYVLTKPYAFKVELPSIDSSMFFWQVYQK
jgi:peptide/nickel transport system substrate-binding protein